MGRVQATGAHRARRRRRRLRSADGRPANETLQLALAAAQKVAEMATAATAATATAATLMGSSRAVVPVVAARWCRHVAVAGAWRLADSDRPVQFTVTLDGRPSNQGLVQPTNEVSAAGEGRGRTPRAHDPCPPARTRSPASHPPTRSPAPPSSRHDPPPSLEDAPCSHRLQDLSGSTAGTAALAGALRRPGHCRRRGGAKGVPPAVGRPRGLPPRGEALRFTPRRTHRAAGRPPDGDRPSRAERPREALHSRARVGAAPQRPGGAVSRLPCAAPLRPPPEPFPAALPHNARRAQHGLVAAPCPHAVRRRRRFDDVGGSG